jgi:DNA replication protein DnaC
MSDAPKLLLAHHLKTLKLPTVLREYDKVAQHCAAEGVDHVQFLARLVELELIDRERRMIERRIKAAKFPTVKSLDSFDFKAMPSLNKMQVLELARCEWIERRENVIALGPSDPASWCPSRYHSRKPRYFAAHHQTADADAGAHRPPA